VNEPNARRRRRCRAPPPQVRDDCFRHQLALMARGCAERAAHAPAPAAVRVPARQHENADVAAADQHEQQDRAKDNSNVPLN